MKNYNETIPGNPRNLIKSAIPINKKIKNLKCLIIFPKQGNRGYNFFFTIFSYLKNTPVPVIGFFDVD